MAHRSYALLLLLVVVTTSLGYTMALRIPWLSILKDFLENPDAIEFVLKAAKDLYLYNASKPEHEACLCGAVSEEWMLQHNMPQGVQLQEALNFFISLPRNLSLPRFQMALRVTKMIQSDGSGSNQSHPTPSPSPSPSHAWTLKPWASSHFSLIFCCAAILI
ncbi:uncharacterized protein [Elaeis guineensis]|uniref:Uncharacterized protein LOC105055699 n=1 Tax=Elaeis guineensis var. tenera TaxID=51953 RepID=A0A6I9S1A4_ELAGV|nr:uncharacterized protein LOC105055699 [Elaeis guineensis]